MKFLLSVCAPFGKGLSVTFANKVKVSTLMIACSLFLLLIDGFFKFLYSAVLCFWADWLPSSCMWLWMSDCSFIQLDFEYLLKWCAYSAVWLLHGWCHMKLLPSWCTFCVHHHAPVYSFIGSHILCRVRVCLAVIRRFTFGWMTGIFTS